MNFILFTWLPVIVCVIFIINLFKNIHAKKIKLPDASFWLIFYILIILAILGGSLLLPNSFTIEFIISICVLVGFIITLCLIFSLWRRMSIKDNQIKTLIQKLALLEKRVRELEGKEK